MTLLVLINKTVCTAVHNYGLKEKQREAFVHMSMTHVCVCVTKVDMWFIPVYSVSRKFDAFITVFI